MIQKGPTGVRESDSLCRALEQRCLELGFELAYLMAQRRLRNLQGRGGPPEVQNVRKLNEIA